MTTTIKTNKNKIDTIQANGFLPFASKEMKLEKKYISKYNLFPLVRIVNGNKSTVESWSNSNNYIYSEQFNKMDLLKEEISKNGNPYNVIVTGAAIITGEKSNLTVIDLDRHGTKKTLDNGEEVEINGIEEFKKILDRAGLTEEERKEAVNTLTVRTPTGGLHLYYKHSDILPGIWSNPDLAIDLRGDGGVIAAPGMKRRDPIEWEYKGKTYTDPNEEVDGVKLKKKVEQGEARVTKAKWGEYVVKKDTEIKELNPKIAMLLQEEYNKFKEKKSTTTTTTTAGAKDIRAKGKEDAEMLARNKLIDLLYPIEPIADGGRNSHFIKLLGHLVRKITDTKEIYILASLINQRNYNPPLSDVEVKAAIKQAIRKRDDEIPYHNYRNGKTDTGKMVAFFSNNWNVYSKGNRLYKYKESEGVYEVMTPEEIEKKYYTALKNNSDIKSARAIEFAKTMLSYNRISEKEAHQESRYIVCDNGVIDTETDEILERGPQYKISCGFKGKLLVKKEFDEAYNKSKFKEFLEKVFSNDQEIITVIGEMMGNILCPHQRELEMITIFLGGGSNGKSSLFDIIESMFRDKDNNICSINMKDFESRFGIAQAQGKRCNIVRDDKIPEEVGNKFNSFVTGEPLATEEKNLPMFRTSYNCPSIYGVNELPNTTNKTNGWYRRQNIIPFKVRFGTAKQVEDGERDFVKDPKLVPYIIDNEKDIIFNFAYYGYKRLRENNFSFSKCAASEEALNEYRNDTDSVYNFVNNCCVLDSTSRTRSVDLHANYKEYCIKEDITSHKNMTKVKNSLKNNFGLEYKKNGGYWYYFGIKLKGKEEQKDWEKEYKALLKEKQKTDHNNEVTMKLVEKLRTKVTMLEDEKKTDLELILRIDELEKDKEKLIKEKNKYIDMYNEEIKESNKLRTAINLLKEKGLL